MAKLSMNKMVEALYDKFIKNAGAPAMGTPGQPSGGQVDPPQVLPKAPVWNLYPEPGVVYPDLIIPPGYHAVYDWANDGVFILNKNCGPIGLDIHHQG